jgi:uracil-DNA glycosylase
MVFRPSTELVEVGWAQALEPVAHRIAAMGDFPRAEVAAGGTYLAVGGAALRAFKRPFADVRFAYRRPAPLPHAVVIADPFNPASLGAGWFYLV